MELPDGLPEETIDVYRGYLKRPVLTRELLIAKIRSYLTTISEASQDRRGLDIGTAGELGGALLRLLRECEDHQLAHAQAAVLYFMESDDAAPDLSSPHGFDDDAALFNAVCRHLGREELSLRLL